MDPAPLLERILDDEGLTAGLDEADAALVVRTLSDHVRKIAAGTRDASVARTQVEALCKRARETVASALAVGDRRKSTAELRRLLSEWVAHPN